MFLSYHLMSSGSNVEVSFISRSKDLYHEFSSSRISSVGSSGSSCMTVLMNWLTWSLTPCLDTTRGSKSWWLTHIRGTPRSLALSSKSQCIPSRALHVMCSQRMIMSASNCSTNSKRSSRSTLYPPCVRLRMIISSVSIAMS